ncbi:MAG: LysM peptidoglycan-binding domain-containing protein [Myxococcota bacterium]|nr:LysM peptidoglycan-binding domain-containing protein [Myxococcota bacterium]
MRGPTTAILTAAFLGAALLLPPAALPLTAEAQRGYVVREGDTLSSIARRHHVTIAELQRANRMRGTVVRPGERLQIPGRSGWRRARGQGRRYTVRAGDTLSRIARRFRVSVDDIRAANALRSEDIRQGQTLLVPRPGQSGAALRASLREGNAPVVPDIPPELEEDEAEAVQARAESLGLGGTPVGQRLLREGAADPRWVEAAGAAEELDGTLRMPVDDGHYLRGWGSGADGYHLAVDIGAAPTTEIHAAERGLVAYAGRGIRGYGNLVILVHPNGWVTAYAHNRRNLVVEGQVVERGEVIARVGQTGFARGPHLHFILVHGGQHCDPVPLFRPRIARATGEEVDEPELVWDTDHRPSGVRCLAREARPHPHYGRGRRRGRRR